MNEEMILEQRLNDFYDRVPDIEDALPFKDYMIKHEDSRMAWYLLGKQYDAKGEEAKARYCFSQAREIYEAFESRALELYDLVPAGTKVTIAKGGLPSDTRVPPERFRLPHTRDETNPHKVYNWLS